MDNDNLTPAEQAVFTDPAIEAAYQGWSTYMLGLTTDQAARNRIVAGQDRKQFLMRIRFLLQQGKLP